MCIGIRNLYIREMKQVIRLKVSKVSKVSRFLNPSGRLETF